MNAQQRDLFAEAREAYSILDAWTMLGLPGEPKAGVNRSPWRDDRHPSLSIFDGGKAWKDHGSGEGGDVVSFIAAALTGNPKDYAAAREWLLERLGIDYGGTPVREIAKRPEAVAEHPEDWPGIEWPTLPVKGTAATWAAFAERRGYSYPGVWTMVQSGVLRFAKVDGHGCFIVSDAAERAAEIRRLDGKLWPGDSKAYPLKGVRKKWLPGFALHDPDAPRDFIITEGATDFLAAFDLVVRYERAGGENRWLPLACLGASNTAFASEIMAAMPGRKVLLIPDGDSAGRGWRDRLAPILRATGATVDAVVMPEGEDLSSILPNLKPEDLCDAFGNCRTQEA